VGLGAVEDMVGYFCMLDSAADLELVVDLLGADLEDGGGLPAVAGLDDGLLVAASLPAVDLPAVADDLV